MKRFIASMVACALLAGCEIDDGDAEETFTYIDDLPVYTPHRYTGSLCEPCSSHGDCWSGGMCISNYQTGEQFCGMYCGKDYWCPSGFICAVNLWVRRLSQCVPTNAEIQCEDGFNY